MKYQQFLENKKQTLFSTDDKINFILDILIQKLRPINIRKNKGFSYIDCKVLTIKFSTVLFNEFNVSIFDNFIKIEGTFSCSFPSNEIINVKNNFKKLKTQKIIFKKKDIQSIKQKNIFKDV